MFEIRNAKDLELPIFPSGTAVPMIAVDGIRVPVRVLDEAEALADKFGKTFYIGVVEKYEPGPPQSELKIIDIAIAAWRPLGNYSPTGEYVLSDDRDAVLAHGCGRLLWVTPKAGATVHDKLNHLVDLLTSETTVFAGHSTKNANTPQLMTICGNLLAQSNFFDEGHVLTAKALELEKALREI